jgi:pimeloyl-ACP methyl ester carboxylesterase
MVKVPTVEDALVVASLADPANAEACGAADVLVSWGYLDLADRLLERLRPHEEYAAQVRRLSAASRQLRRSGIIDELTALGESGVEIDGRHEAYTARHKGGSRKVIIVFTGLDPRFWLSLMVLHAFLKRLGTHIVYLTDLRQLIFFDGLATVARGYRGLLMALLETIRSLGADDIHVMGNSAGGYVALRYAMDLHAKTFLGTSIRTDLSPGSRLPINEFFRNPQLAPFAAEMSIDLKPLLSRSAWPERIMLFCGEDNPGDLPHALHLADLPNVEVTTLAGYGNHDVISGLLGRGEFEAVLKRFMDPGPLDTAIRRI